MQLQQDVCFFYAMKKIASVVNKWICQHDSLGLNSKK